MRLARTIRVSRNGITLIEMLVVMALISLMAGLSYPSVASGIESIRLRNAAGNLAGFFNLGLTYVERRQQTVELQIYRQTGRILFRSIQPGLIKDFALPDGTAISRMVPPVPVDFPDPVRILLYPGASFPRFGVELTNRKGARRLIRIDPVTGVPQVESPAANPEEEEE